MPDEVSRSQRRPAPDGHAAILCRVSVPGTLPPSLSWRFVVNETLTIVLPVYNAERHLSRMVRDILELAVGCRHDVRVAIVDDGSTDDTFEIACSLERTYPQLSVLRQPFQRGLGPALDRVRRALGATFVLAHDGVSPLDLAELARNLQDDLQTTPSEMAEERRGSRRFASIAALHSQMAQAHRNITTFRWLQLEDRTAPRRQTRPVRPLADSASAPMPAPVGNELLSEYWHASR
ncbi:MAG: glycosyltransferase [Planctomycetales bacterium]|nr:glycosyltransferase [Planctomycetales bacterium]